ncbi:MULTISPECIES: nucleotidyltransferase family protein [Methanothrix]|jgi:NDP-sugar pyrophosphorylase family protein|uniref:nucleotidyltransferase family protein n=1 Tax=Methanothrix TaxID=2222 RepID=UPI0023F304B9|nr:sugar phosphate nucleotidyltransferase [Methanothrix sp.]MCK9405128.1 sugar phosphate nucleotidyltransferase [Methanothrix sp.]MCK9586491.1 sugar phosphate nucleotidyltransferase [Methanothrix soehngenii]MDD4487109.1 sugar phosphate nucleotidyltransferase [Methanothrix soehngenii]MDD5734441.1 sugar phosphate nucleotidyltransferase [Methanothrix soehngenii]
MKAVILAGGLGTRLKPYTTVFPKPLMPIGESPILEIIIKQLKAKGFNEITLAVGHLSELIMAFFNNGSKYGLKIEYSKEEKKLGTAGGLGLLKNKLEDDFLVMNGDVLTGLDFSEFLEFHKKTGSIATIALNRRHVDIDFGVVELDENRTLIGYIEKPKIDYLVSMGVYAFNESILEYIPSHEYLDIPDLMKRLLSEGEKVNGFIHDGYWLDIGRPDDYIKANEDIQKIYRELGVSIDET